MILKKCYNDRKFKHVEEVFMTYESRTNLEIIITSAIILPIIIRSEFNSVGCRA